MGGDEGDVNVHVNLQKQMMMMMMMMMMIMMIMMIMMMMMMMMTMTLMKLVNSRTKFRPGIDKFYQPNSGCAQFQKRGRGSIYIHTHTYSTRWDPVDSSVLPFASL